MSQSDRAVKKLATQLARLDREVKSWRGAQADFTSIENGGNFTFKDGDGNVTAIMGGQDDGSNTIRHVDGPTPPIPSGLSAHVDGPIVQVSWDGTFESDVTHDWHYLEVLAVGPSNEQLTGTINDLSGGETSLAATSQGDWFITARSVSRAGKRSLDGDAGTVAVQLVGLTGAIEAVQESANGKNTIYYSPTEPVAPDGGFNNGDLWFDTSEEGNNTASVWDGNGWVSMEDARLATIIAAQEALESDLQDVQTSVDGKNKITYDPALPPSSYVGAVGDTWYRTSGNSMIGFWKWDGAAWVQQELSTTVIPQIDIGAGTFGSLSGARLEAGTVSASSIAVGDFSNLATIDPVRNVNVTRPESWSTETVGDYITPKATSQNYLMFKDRTDTVPFKAGDQLRVEFKGVSDVNGSALLRLWGYPALADGTTSGLVGVSGDSFSFTTTEQSFSGKVTIPESFGASTTLRSWIIGLGPQGGLDMHGVRVRDVRVYRMTDTTLIQNGAITTDKLAVGSITAESGIIESLDLGTATVGELDGIRIMGQSIRGEQLSGDAIDGKVSTGGTYRTTGGSGSWSDAGLFIAQPDGTSMVRFPTDGSPLSLTASDTQIERASITDLDLSYGAVRSGGELTLASGVTAPVSPPELTTGWQKVCTLDTPDSELTYDWLGLGYWSEGSGHLVRAVNVLGSEGDGYDRIEVYDYATGDFQNSILTGLNPRSGVTVIGDVAYVMGPDYEKANIGKQWVHGFDLNTGARVTRWEFVNFFDPKQAKVALGNDGSNLVVAGVAPTRRLHVFRYNPTTGAQVSSWEAAPGWSGGQGLLGVSVNSAGTEVTILPLRTARVYTVSNSVLVRKTDTANANGYAGWDNPNRNGAGMVFVGTNPYVVDSGAVYKGSTSASDYTSELCFTWYNGTHETTASSVAVVDVAARETVTVSLPVRAGLQKRLYSRAQGGTNWARSTVAADATAVPVPVGVPSFAPPTVNSFPNADPATLKSTNDKFEVKGDGSGHWGPLTFNPDGSMSGIRKTSSGTLTVSAPSGGGTTNTWVTFPEGRFKTAPTVTTSLRSTSPNSASVSTGGATATGFYIYFYRVNDNATGVNWIATEEG